MVGVRASPYMRNSFAGSGSSPKLLTFMLTMHAMIFVHLILAYQSLASEHAESHASEHAESLASEQARLWLHSPLDPFMCHQLPYMTRQRSTSQTYNHPLISSVFNALCKTHSRVPEFLPSESRRVIRTRWPLVECITLPPSQ